MTHRFNVGQQVHFAAVFSGVGTGVYKVVRQLPVENDRQVRYRIKGVGDAFERIAEEGQLSRLRPALDLTVYRLAAPPDSATSRRVADSIPAQAVLELRPFQPDLDRLEDLDDDLARMLEERAARPVAAGIQRDGNAGQLQHLAERGDAGLVDRRIGRIAAGALGKDDQLASGRDMPARRTSILRMPWPPFERSTGTMPRRATYQPQTGM